MRQRLGAAVACALILATIAPPLFAQCVPDPAASNVALVGGGVLFVCPAGDGPTMASIGVVLQVQVVDISGAICPSLTYDAFEVDGFPPGAIWDGVGPNGEHNVLASGLRNLGFGNYELDGALIAGGTNAGIIVKVAGVVIGRSPLPLSLTGADLNSDGIVNISDIGTYTVGFYSPDDWRFDFNSDGIINVSDVGIMVSHLGGTYPPGFGLDPVD